jgi:hypothetical protein
MTMWGYLLWIALIPQLIIVILAIRLYRSSRIRSVALLMWACICLVIARTSWFTFGFFPGLFSPDSGEANRELFRHWSERAEIAFQFASFVLLAAALWLFVRRRPDNGTPIV